jgi:hypothetical protein
VPYFHSVDGEYIRANPPVEAAVRRELFFNLIHESRHAFNMAHSLQKQMGRTWTPPNWMPLESNKQELSLMNYPDAATPGGGGGANASWFYQRFGFRFDDGELLFMRQAPASPWRWAPQSGSPTTAASSAAAWTRGSSWS